MAFLTNSNLYNNYPNPFNPVTKIKFDYSPLERGVRRTGCVCDGLTIYDILGKEVATLVNEQLKPGTYEAEFDGSNYPSGVYFYTLETETFVQTKKDGFNKMKKIIYIFIIFYFHFLIVPAQAQFQFTIGGTNDEYGCSVIQTTDGGYAMTGYTYSFGAGDADLYIVKLNSSGSVQWTKTMGWAGNDFAGTMVQTSDNGYVLAGYTVPYGSIYYDMLIIKLDTAGSVQWCRVINRTNYEYVTSVKQTADGGYILIGISATGGTFTDEFFLVKLNSAGTYQWSKTYGGPGDDIATSVIQTQDGGYAVAGLSNSFGPYNVFTIIKTDSLGNIQWNRLIEASGTGSHVYSIIQISDGSFVLAGEFSPIGVSPYDMYIVKLNSSGSIQWTRTVGGTGYDKANSVVQSTDGGFILAGYTNSFGAGNNDFYIVKLNSSGVLQWSKTVGGTGDDQAQSIIKTTDGGFVAAGYTSSFGTGGKDMFIVKFDPSGNTCGNTTSPSSSFGTSGTATNPTFSVVTQNPTVTSPTPTTGTGGILTTICIVGIPSAPTLVSPPNGSFNQPSTIRFIWNKPLYAASYRIQIALDSLFTNIVVNDSTIADSTILVANLTVNKYYWWRVNAKNESGTSPYSTIWRFGTFPVGVKEISSGIPEQIRTLQ